jgi:hypothetical protein
MKCIFFALLLALFTFPAMAQAQKTTPEQEKLAVFKGHWTIEGSENSYLEICDWIQGNHIQCISSSKEKTGVDSSTSYLSYSALEKTYIYFGLYGSGNTRSLKGNWDTDRFVFEGQRTIPEKTTRWKITIIPVGKNLHFIEEASVNQSPFEKKADFIYKRIQ